MSANRAAASRPTFFALIGLTLAFKIWLSAVFPVTGDEAYFIQWGEYPALGYYDHPPMVGWLLALLLRVSSSGWWLRLPITLLPAILSIASWWALRRRDEEKALLAALAILLVPLHVWNVFITTDMPLVLFGFFATLAFWQASERRSARLYAVAGILLGLAFLSKYFAVLLALAFFAFVAASPKGARDWRGLAIAFAGSLPFAMLNAYWNYEHCWANLMFNLYNRHDDAGPSWKTPLLYLASLLYLISPVALYQLWRTRGGAARLWQEPGFRLLAMVSGLPLLLFALMSAVKMIGLHWVLSFVPIFYLAAAIALSAVQLRASVVYLGLFSLAHVALILAAGVFPLETWKPLRIYDGIVFHFRIEEILGRLDRYRAEYQFAADGYSPAATASYYARRSGLVSPAATPGEADAGTPAGDTMIVFGTASSHARHDDILTDFRRLEGRNILVLRKNPPEERDYAPYFRSIEVRTLAVSGVTFYLVLGRGFDFSAYRDRVLARLRDRYYRIPSYLPQGRCYFCERYFESRTCPVRS